MKYLDEKTTEAIEKLKGMLASEGLRTSDIDEKNNVDDEWEDVDMRGIISCFNETIDLLTDITDILDDIRVLLPASDFDEEEAFKEAAGEEEEDAPEDDPYAMFFFNPGQRCRLFPFDDVFEIFFNGSKNCVVKKIPEADELYLLYENDKEIPDKEGNYLLYPIIIIKLDEQNNIATPDAVDRFYVRKYLEDNSKILTIDEKNDYSALRLT